MSLFCNSVGFGNLPVFPSSFGSAGCVFEGGTAVFEVHGMWVLGTELGGFLPGSPPSGTFFPNS